jgi:hypothetical protein
VVRDGLATGDRDALQLDFMARIDGIHSFERLRANAMPVHFGGHPLLVASLRDQIRRLLAVEPSKRTNFLRARVPFRGSSI